MEEAIFRAPPKPRDASSGEALAEILRERPAKILAPYLDSLDPPAVEDTGQAADGGLDFGKLGHPHDMAKGAQAR